MGKSLSMTVVAQGVETREQADVLRAQARDELQGFYFKRPLPPEQFAEMLHEQTYYAPAPQTDVVCGAAST
jgi:EAL domain-containing protein (putative c-di-GMP-specific phosphodiesterase class I)